jgi:hypothetical protein
MYFVYLHENRTVKSIKIVLRRQGMRMRENDGRGKSNQGTL